VAPREGEPGCEAASELKMSSSSLAKADLRLPGPGGREGVMVAVEAIIGRGRGGLYRVCEGGRLFWCTRCRSVVWNGDMNGIRSLTEMIRLRIENRQNKKVDVTELEAHPRPELSRYKCLRDQSSTYTNKGTRSATAWSYMIPMRPLDRA